MTPEKIQLHPRNAHRQPYDFNQLIQTNLKLAAFVHQNKFGKQTIDFSNPKAVLELNAALLEHFYGVKNWSIPEHFLCPPVPGRADYIHHIADLLALSTHGEIPIGGSVVGLDIGVGANCIYPLLGSSVYNWNFVAIDILEASLQNCSSILRNNPQISQKISLQQQLQPRFIFKNIITANDRFAFTMCNPPFHNSAEAAAKGSSRKVSNLTSSKVTSASLNFGGQQQELWCDGGERTFITNMMYESVHYANQCLWFTSLVSKQANLPALYNIASQIKASQVKTIEMSQGQKNSRILAWTFQTDEQQTNWIF